MYATVEFPQNCCENLPASSETTETFFFNSLASVFFWQLNLFAIHGDVAKDDFQTNNKVTKIYDGVDSPQTDYLMSSRKFSATMLILFP